MLKRKVQAIQVWTAQNGTKIASVALAALVLTLMLAPVGATSAQSTLDVDLTPFFTSLNNYLPIFIGIFAIVGGIAGAIALSRMLINAIVDAFKGGSL